ncbi:MAG: hypothetical protein GY777_30010, partial [Candidatus Brocadiaceae bacterium]|nr:hypothetical protein [Candidatus Brocadiaceae bacterium]
MTSRGMTTASVTEIPQLVLIVSGMEAYMPHSFPLTNKKKLGLTILVLMLSATRREHSDSTNASEHLNLTLFLFLPGIVQSLFFANPKNLSNNFNTTSSFPPLFYPDGSVAIFSSDKAQLFAQTFYSSSNLDDFGAVPPSPPPSNLLLPDIKISFKDVFSALSGLDSRKAYGPDGVPPVVLKNCASVLTP